MEFTSLEFIFIFLPVFLVLYIITRNYTLRLTLLIGANLFFILGGNNPFATLFWLLLITCVTYGIGQFIEKNKQANTSSHKYLWNGILVILLFLTFFKLHSGGFGDGRFDILLCGHTAELFLCQNKSLFIPLGISFLTFQAISYLVDVSKNQISHEKNIFKFLVWMLFFPKLVSGPLVNYKSVQDWLSKLETNSDNIADGLRLIFEGIIKRILIANQVGVIANAVFGMPINGVTPLFAWLGLMAYTIQIYFDFSGYTNIAIGLGKIVGVRLPENFNYPYIAESVTDFWRRWHITLSTWFREYVFFPLERKRWKYVGRNINILIIFILTGLWHGFSLNFLIWGILHGTTIMLENILGTVTLNKIPKILRHFYTLVIVMAGWVFFRSPTFTFAIEFFKKLLGNSENIVPLPFSVTTPLPFVEPTFLLALTIGIIVSLPISIIANSIVEKNKERSRVYFIAFQLTQDIVLFFFFILAIAAHLSGAFIPNIYANF